MKRNPLPAKHSLNNASWKEKALKEDKTNLEAPLECNNNEEREEDVCYKAGDRKLEMGNSPASPVCYAQSPELRDEYRTPTSDS
ncbi:MAG: hypothetical protein KDD02_20775 [Phaeodactylibacter sp.]|nr:hypothetical protein [Phaeodactylibacter sp.]MCB9303279.1 hypothetical protein [Lewinellaceae bacterium]